MKNPFPYSCDNKRYYTMNYYLKTKYQQKVAKVPLHAGFTCPNRDGTKGMGGCTFCSSKGSGDSILGFDDDLMTQYNLGLEHMRHKWPNCLGIAYFQSYSNTYAPLDVLKTIYDPFFASKENVGVAIATRADCLNPEMIDYFDAQEKDVWIELGLQSVHKRTMAACNRAHTTRDVWDALKKMSETSIKTCIHIINSLPGESQEDMIETARQVADHSPDAVKIHMLHILKHTQMDDTYKEHPFHLQTLDEYVDTVIQQLEVLPPNCIIERLTGDGLTSNLTAPAWITKKTIVRNEIDKKMARLNTYQGAKYKTGYTSLVI